MQGVMDFRKAVWFIQCVHNLLTICQQAVHNLHLIIAYPIYPAFIQHPPPTHNTPFSIHHPHPPPASRHPLPIAADQPTKKACSSCVFYMRLLKISLSLPCLEILAQESVASQCFDISPLPSAMSQSLLLADDYMQM